MLAANTILQGRYRVIRHLGRGGMGSVYEALNERVNSIVALKETFAETEMQREAFEQEAKRLANLDHDAFPKVMDHFFEGDGQYLVMELIRGTDLAELLTLRESPFVPSKVLEWADQLLDALEELHAYPIIHRDIKPANLKLTRKGKIKLLDFGIAKGAAGQMTTLKTDRSGGGYTPHYAPLEQMLRSGSHWSEGLSIVDGDAVERVCQQTSDGRTDLYALGATLYHLMTGVMPPDAATRALSVWTGKPDRLRPACELNSQVPSAVSAVLMHAMALERNDRPATARDLRRLLRDAIHQPLTQPPTELSPELEGRASERREAANRRYAEEAEQALQGKQAKAKEGSGGEETTVLGTVTEKPPTHVSVPAGQPAVGSVEASARGRLEAEGEGNELLLKQEELQPLATESTKSKGKGQKQENGAKAAHIEREAVRPGVEETVEINPKTVAVDWAKMLIQPINRKPEPKGGEPLHSTLLPVASVAPGITSPKRKLAPPIYRRRSVLILAGIVLLMIAMGVVLLLWNQAEVPRGEDLPVDSGQTQKTPENPTAKDESRITGAAQPQASTPASQSPAPPGMVYVPGGTFTMGRRDGDEAERPAHQVTVGHFYIDIYEVTNEDYEKFVKSTGHGSPATWKNRSFPSGAARRPVTGVTWDDANAYANWAEKRLPTEEEWEFAARGTDGRVYPWGNDWRQGSANANGAEQSMADAGAYKGTSAFGAFDMVGNAWEWTASDLKAYPRGRLPANLPIGQLKVIRGGSYQSTKDFATTTYRTGWPSRGASDYNNTGFRCVMNSGS